jgi:hypothetical protein
MEPIITRGLLLIGLPLIFLAIQTASAATEDLGNGFAHHGVATPISNHRGTVATVDGQGHDVVLSWLRDHRGCYELLLVDVESGKAEEYPLPFPVGDDPFASILSTGNRFYTHFNSHFVEFDPVKRAFTFFHKTAPQMAMSMTEDDRGVIWSVTYPQSGVVSYNPKTGAFKDYGQVYPQNWAQYPRSVAVDDAGWVYFGIGSTANQILLFDPATGKATPLVPEEQRGHGSGSVYRDVDGKVYGQAGAGQKDDWYVFYKGRATRIGAHEQSHPKPIIAGSQGLFHRDFPDGKRLETFDLVERVLVVQDPRSGKARTIHFNYQSEGAHVMGLAAAPDHSLCGGTAFPMRFFRFDPAKDEWTNRAAYGQWNTVARQGDHFFVGAYTGGVLLEWDPARPWVPTQPGQESSNPRLLTRCEPAINRPHKLLAHPDGKTIVMGGTPGYGYTGGGLLFWDRETQKSVLLTHEQILPDHSTLSLVTLPGGRLLGGTTTSPGTGGEKKAKEAELYLMDMATKRLEWHQALFPGVQGYTDLCLNPDGLVYGFADRSRFFVFDPAQRKVVHEEDTQAGFGPTASQQGPRVFVPGPKGEIYVLFVKGIARIEPRTFRITLLAASPVPVACGGDLLDGRIYFASGSHVYSYKLPE